jgi:hypothetical protein
MISLKQTLSEALHEREMEEGWKDSAKKAATGAAFGLGMMGSNPSHAPIQKPPTTQAMDFQKDFPKGLPPKSVKNVITPANLEVVKKHIRASLKAVESSGGKDNVHRWMEKGPNKGERAIGAYGFMPSTIKDMVSKDKKLKAKYGKILPMSSGNYQQDEIENFVNRNPHFQDDLINAFIDHAIKIMPAGTTITPSLISQAVLYGPYGVIKQLKNATPDNPTGIPADDKITGLRNAKAEKAYEKSMNYDDMAAKGKKRK